VKLVVFVHDPENADLLPAPVDQAKKRKAWFAR
jgi:hypothetical protein